MVSAKHASPNCPVCSRADLVKTTQAAYNAGVARCAPPDMPTRNVPMTMSISAAAVVVGICVFMILVFIGGMGAGFPIQWQLILVSVTIVCILAALVISYVAFQRVVRGDAEATLRFPAWDQAMETYRNLYYCSRDDVVFDSRSDKLISNDQLERLRHSVEKETHQSRAAMASH